jgi:hypothetical protein
MGNTSDRGLYVIAEIPHWMKFPNRRIALLGLATMIVGCDMQQGETVPESQLQTRWASEVTAERVHPEYPRPQMVRAAWTNLNGLWDYAIRDSAAPQPAEFDGHIMVPFPVESQLSGVMRWVTPDMTVWYRRTFELPNAPDDQRWLLHFGAVDWLTRVSVNGERVGEHRGGYDPFEFDITDVLRPGGEQELVVSVWDPTDRGDQPRGKQVLDPHGIWYTAVTGIWQTVWLEAVPDAHITALKIVPDVDAGTVTVRVSAANTAADVGVQAAVSADDRVVARAESASGEPLTLGIPNAHLWSPNDPYLYQLSVRLATGDSVQSYFGMRKISIARAADGHRRLFLNNEPLFQFGPLDQGWWPDGLYTAATDAALLNDVEVTKRLGFNMARKHVKVEPARWYYHCDRLGLMVWQDMPSGNNESEEGKEEFRVELQNMVDALYNSPSVVMWVPFNEGWGQHDTERYVDWLQEYDPTRLVNNASGWSDRGVGDVSDIHRYPGPGMAQLEPRRVAVLGEFGGLGLPLEGHLWVDRDNWGYRAFATREALGEAYSDLLYQLRPLIGEGLAAAVYTQTSDVEIEVNGLLTYDRALEKLPADVVTQNKSVYSNPPIVREVVPTSRRSGQLWRFTTDEPAADWHSPNYDDAAWEQGLGGFGTDGTPGAVVGTIWETDRIWLRRVFELETVELVNPHLRIHHDEDAEVYLNGELIGSFPGYTADYLLVPLDETAIGTLHPGENVLAVHVRQTGGGQYIDIGIVELLEPETK